MVKSAEEVKREFRDSGISISAWAIEHGVSAQLVYQVLSGKRQAIRGESHKIAVLLGLKAGRIVNAKELTIEEYRK
jgi:gp16 family phage-associated protein